MLPYMDPMDNVQCDSPHGQIQWSSYRWHIPTKSDILETFLWILWSFKCVQFQILVASLVEDMGIWFFRDPTPPFPHGSPPEFPVSTCATSTAERRPPFPPAFSSLVAPRGEGMEGAALSPSRRMERRETISKTALLVRHMPKLEG